MRGARNKPTPFWRHSFYTLDALHNYLEPKLILRYAALSLIILLSWGTSHASPFTYNLTAQGRLQSGPIVINAINLDLLYSFDSLTPDLELSNVGGVYVGTSSAFRLNPINTPTIAASTSLFTNYSAGLQSYSILVQFSSGAFNLDGRDLLLAAFSYHNFTNSMLESDALPVDVSFASRSSAVTSTLIFTSVLGDPNFQGGGTTNFALCQSEPTDACVYAPLTLSANTIPLPAPIHLVILPLIGIFLYARKRAKLDA